MIQNLNLRAGPTTARRYVLIFANLHHTPPKRHLCMHCNTTRRRSHHVTLSTLTEDICIMGGDDEKSVKWNDEYHNALCDLFRSRDADPENVGTSNTHGVLKRFKSKFPGQSPKNFNKNYKNTAEKYLLSKGQNGKRSALAMADGDTSGGDSNQRE
jgi:hypothetical protein